MPVLRVLLTQAHQLPFAGFARNGLEAPGTVLVFGASLSLRIANRHDGIDTVLPHGK
jgi:hypothetical protein